MPVALRRQIAQIDDDPSHALVTATSGKGDGPTIASTCLLASAGIMFVVSLRSASRTCADCSLGSSVTLMPDCFSAPSRTIFGALVGEWYPTLTGFFALFTGARKESQSLRGNP